MKYENFGFRCEQFEEEVYQTLKFFPLKFLCKGIGNFRYTVKADLVASH